MLHCEEAHCLSFLHFFNNLAESVRRARRNPKRSANIAGTLPIGNKPFGDAKWMRRNVPCTRCQFGYTLGRGSPIVVRIADLWRSPMRLLALAALTLAIGAGSFRVAAEEHCMTGDFAICLGDPE